MDLSRERVPWPIRARPCRPSRRTAPPRLPSVEVDSYNVELKDDEGFLGDRASKGAFRAIIDNWRKAAAQGRRRSRSATTPTEDISKKKLDALLTEGDPEAAGIVQGAIEDFAQELALVIRRFLKLKAWRDTERIVIGGGFRAQPGRRARHRPRRRHPQGRQDHDRSGADPQRAGRGRPDRRRASGAAPGCSRRTTRSWRSTSAAPTSAPAWSSST